MSVFLFDPIYDLCEPTDDYKKLPELPPGTKRVPFETIASMYIGSNKKKPSIIKNNQPTVLGGPNNQNEKQSKKKKKKKKTKTKI